MSSQKIARLNNAEIQFAGRFAEAVAKVRRLQVEHQAAQTRARVVLQFAAGFGVVTCLLIGLFLFGSPLAVLVVILVMLARLTGPVTALSQAGQSIANALPAYQALCATLTDLERNASTVSRLSFAQTDGVPAAVTLEGINFAYPGQGMVLARLDLLLRPGEVVALAGPSGAGKTTLLDIIAGLQEPDCGTVRIDGAALRDDADRRAWRRDLAVLPQDPFLFDTTIRENLLWGARSPDEADIRMAMDITGLLKFVEGLPDGLATRVGERGQNLSGGERQRLCLARALLRKPRVIILDEATNALDPHLEDAVFSRLVRMRDRISLLYVTHRASALRHADRVLKLSEGRLTEV
jgi:ABC-type bacteriocin/lantibiotic exporter with double-glycine peptidase domain